MAGKSDGSTVVAKVGDATIKTLHRSEVGAALRLLRAQLDEHAIPVRDDELRRSVEELFVRPYLGDVLLLWRGGQAVGLAFLTYSWTPEIGGMTCWFDELYVQPAHREAGLGSHLLRAGVALAEERGCCSVDLQVEHSHERAAALYTRHGFKEQPRRTFRLDLRTADTERPG